MSRPPTVKDVQRRVVSRGVVHIRAHTVVHEPVSVQAHCVAVIVGANLRVWRPRQQQQRVLMGWCPKMVRVARGPAYLGT